MMPNACNPRKKKDGYETYTEVSQPAVSVRCCFDSRVAWINSMTKMCPRPVADQRASTVFSHEIQTRE